MSPPITVSMIPGVVMNPHTLVNKLVPILYEDDHLLAVEKPVGVDAGGLASQSAAGLSEILSNVRGQGETFEPANRLSRYESGVLLLGKEPAIVSHIRAGLKLMRITQEYVAVVLGQMRVPRLTVGSGHTNTRGKRKQRMPKRARALAGAAAEARTTLSLIQQGEHRALVRCRTNVRNTHTLRAQLRSVQLRLLGDSLHDRSRRSISVELTCLHLSRITFYHPGINSKITLASEPPDAFKAITDGQRGFERALHAALVRRLTCMVKRDTDSYRLLTGNAEGVKGLVAEKYGLIVVLQVLGKPDAMTESLQQIARWYRDTLDADAVYMKRFVKDRLDVDEEATGKLRSPKPLVGKRMPEQIEIMERGLKFAIRPYDGFSVGLFLDHRDNRNRVRSMAKGKDMLNLFAYTCGFSLAAAAGGASTTVSVDLSPKHLEWGRANFKLNGLDWASHQFVCSDAFDYLRRAAGNSKAFDLIVLDPPTFAHGRKRKQDFSAVRDLPDLIAASVSLLRPGGVMMLSTSYRRMSLRGLRERIKQGAGRRRFKVIETPPLPVDFAVDPDHAKTIFARFE